MKTILIMYMPGHAGHFLARLFGLSSDVMPLVTKTLLEQLVLIRGKVPADLNRLELYKFSNVKTKFDSWQIFHREFADHKDFEAFKKLELSNRGRYSSIIFPIHPFEFHYDFDSTQDYDCYYVDLDLDQWGNWVSREQEKLNFVVRPDEWYYFNKHKKLHNMKPISLTAMLSGENDFCNEYQRISTLMGITPNTEQALLLFKDWQSVRLAVN